ncbi:DUF4381 domain-containing protein [Methylomonas rhizoryzae]|uniref:DUF4381 domain-containing protein n=1 Tax=Methylomonas rhizoryzae TaxID=2608981 RepID=UPI001232C272|nr:DUF4381 domain-containing protein [Methylomonas rhizoryzae]
MDQLPLKDIHLPQTIGWWPPAPGWWLVALALGLAVWAGVRWFRRLRRLPVYKEAQRVLNDLRAQGGDSRTIVSALSELLRRVAISGRAREQVASLRGEAWLNYLDRSLPDAPFSRGLGRCLADAHYRPELADVDVAALFDLCERWLKQQGKQG